MILEGSGGCKEVCGEWKLKGVFTRHHFQLKTEEKKIRFWWFILGGGFVNDI